LQVQRAAAAAGRSSCCLEAPRTLPPSAGPAGPWVEAARWRGTRFAAHGAGMDWVEHASCAALDSGKHPATDMSLVIDGVIGAARRRRLLGVAAARCA
jgi:hypothetical protein